MNGGFHFRHLAEEFLNGLHSDLARPENHSIELHFDPTGNLGSDTSNTTAWHIFHPRDVLQRHIAPAAQETQQSHQAGYPGGLP